MRGRLRAGARLLALRHLRDGANVIVGGAAASAHNIQPAVVDELRQLRRERVGRFQVLAFLIRQPGVRIAGDKASWSAHAGCVRGRS